MRASVETKIRGYSLGDSVGHCQVPPELGEHAAACAAAFFGEQEQQGFHELVDTRPVPSRFKHLGQTWISAAARMKALGYRPTTRHQHWVLTAGVETHSDDAFGPILVWTVHNDGLQFWQRGGARRTPAAGDIMIFDDRIDHSMDLTRAQMKNTKFDRAVWIGWAIALDQEGDCNEKAS